MGKRVPLATAFLTSFLSVGAFSALLALNIAELTATVALAQTGSFYNNKTIKIIVGSTPGGFYDRWARLLAQYMPRYIPGKPSFVVQNMPGGGSLIAANYLFLQAKPDGLTLGMPNNGIYIDQLVGRSQASFRIEKFRWIGSQEKLNMVLAMRSDGPYKSAADIIKAKMPPKCGESGTDNVLAGMLEETLGLKIISVTGYQGGSEVDLALERGEVQCRFISITIRFGREPYISWHQKAFVRDILQTGDKRDQQLPDTPTVFDLMDEYKTPQLSRGVAQVILAGYKFGRPMVAPPGTAQDRVEVLREAYLKTLHDSDLLRDARKAGMVVMPIPGEELQALAKDITDQPREIIDRVQKILKE
jgi:tripartite-type tricarboxylate transporter receptor subunit TctC